ncbi:MAG: hypothetical protein ACXU81_08455 [Myxococcaceae bacterium]
MPPRSKRTTLLRVGLVVLGALALVVLVVALALPSLARSKTRDALDGLEGARGEFQDVQATLFPLRYTVTRLKITRKDAVLKQPLLYAERIEVTLRASSLLRGVLRGTVEADRVKMVLEQPKPGGDGRMPTLAELIPLKAVVERLRLHDSEVLYAWVREKGRPSVWSHGIDATLENLGSRPGLAEGPMELVATGTVATKGKARVTVRAQPHAERLTFSATASIDGFDPAQMNAYLAAIQEVTLTSGVFATRMQFRCEAGRLSGLVRPELEGSQLQGKGDLGSAIKALFGRTAMAFSGPTEGTRPDGAIAVSDDLTDPKLQLAPRVEKVIENGFILGLQESLTRNYHGPPDHDAKPGPTPLKADGKK